MRRWLLALVLVAGCGPEASSVEQVPISRWRAGLTMAAAGGCDTSIAAGLSQQLIEELNCVAPNLMVDFSGPEFTLYSAVWPWLAPDAARDVRAATVERNDTMTISSAYRTLGQQYLLYKWWQAGQCGIQVAAVPGSSNHQSGRAIDTPYYSTWRTALENHGWTWLGSSDLVHFDHLASPNVASNSVLAFQRLWNKNNPGARLVEDGDWGPATEGAMAQTPTTGFAVHGCVTTGTLAGVVTEQGTGAKLAGVEVSAGAQTKLTGADGAFSFTLGAGAVTVRAQKAGYEPVTLTRTVPVGGAVDASLSLTPSTGTAVLRGAVVDASSAAVADAQLFAGAASATSSSSGAFELVLPAGALTLFTTKAGFALEATPVTLVAGQTTTLTITLHPRAGDGAPVVVLTTPPPGGAFERARVTLSGLALDDGGPVASLSLSQNAGTARAVTVTAGRFEVEVQLAPGNNTVELAALDGVGQRGATTWAGCFRAGFDGVVHRFDDAAALLADAELSLIDGTSGQRLGAARSGVDGRFSLDAAAAGVARLHVTRDGYTLKTLLVDVSAEARTAVDVALTPGDAPGLRFLEPTGTGPFEVEELTVSGVVTGLEVVAVRVNDVPATLVGSGFVAKVPLAEGRTTLHAIAEGPLGESVSAELEVTRPLSPVRGGCGAVDGWPLLGLLVLFARRAR